MGNSNYKTKTMSKVLLIHRLNILKERIIEVEQAIELLNLNERTHNNHLNLLKSESLKKTLEYYIDCLKKNEDLTLIEEKFLTDIQSALLVAQDEYLGLKELPELETLREHVDEQRSFRQNKKITGSGPFWLRYKRD